MSSPADYLDDYSFEFALRPESCALVIIDMQYASAWRTTGLGRQLAERGRAQDADWRFTTIERKVVPNIQRLLTLFRNDRLCVVYVTVGSAFPDYRDMSPRHRPFVSSVENWQGNPNHRIIREIEPGPSDIVLNKTTTSAFTSTPIDAVLRFRGVTQVLLAGVSTNNCVDTTGRDAADRGFECVLLEDACSAANEQLHSSALTGFARAFGRVDATDNVLDELRPAT